MSPITTTGRPGQSGGVYWLAHAVVDGLAAALVSAAALAAAELCAATSPPHLF